MNEIKLDDLITELTAIEEDRSEENNYPPKGTEETALIVWLDEEAFTVVAHTGRFFHSHFIDAGLQEDELNISTVERDPGVYVFSGGKVWESRDWETGVVDDYGIDGLWRLANAKDLKDFDYEAFDVRVN